jgi:hypothetical protein
MAGFATLADIVPMPQGEVTIRGKKLPIVDMDVGAIGRLLMKFPEVAAAVEKQGTLDVPMLLACSGAVVNVILALGTGGSEADAKAAGSNLALSEKATLLAAILERAIPDGIGPFVKLLKVLRLDGVKGAPAAQAAPARPDKIRLRGTRSEKPSTR